jgi:hypothetical protein
MHAHVLACCNSAPRPCTLPTHSAHCPRPCLSSPPSQWGFKCTASDSNATDGITTTSDPKCDIAAGAFGSAGSPVWDSNTTQVRSVVSHENLGPNRTAVSLVMTQVRLTVFLPFARDWRLYERLVGNAGKGCHVVHVVPSTPRR